MPFVTLFPQRKVGIDYTGDCNLREKDEEGEPFNYGLWPPVWNSTDGFIKACLGCHFTEYVDMIEGYSIKNMDTQIIAHQAPIKTYIDFLLSIYPHQGSTNRIAEKPDPSPGQKELGCRLEKTPSKRKKCYVVVFFAPCFFVF